MAMVPAAAPAGELVPGVMPLVEFNERASQLRDLLAKARDGEAAAFTQLKACQTEILAAIASNDRVLYDLHEKNYQKLEDAWRHSVLYTAELRAEMQDLARERHGDYTQERDPGNVTTHHSKTVHVASCLDDHRGSPARGASGADGTATPGGRGLPLTLERTKAVPLRAGDISGAPAARASRVPGRGPGVHGGPEPAHRRGAAARGVRLA